MTVLRTLRANAEGQKKNIPVIILTAETDWMIDWRDWMPERMTIWLSLSI